MIQLDHVQTVTEYLEVSRAVKMEKVRLPSCSKVLTVAPEILWCAKNDVSLLERLDQASAGWQY